MFSPPPTSAAGTALAVARKRPRAVSRPSSRSQHHERSGSGASFGVKRHRDGRESGTEGGEMSMSSKAPTVISHGTGGGKDMDGGVVDWTRNAKYRVSKLPALPAILKTSTATETAITGYTDSFNNRALILTHTHAYIWHYTDIHTLPYIFSFPLPLDEGATADISSPFPLGTFVSPSANSHEPGLVVVMPMTGRIAYWDAVGSAVAEGLFTKKRGVEGKVPLMGSESVLSICSLEPAGFILSLSSGRLAHLALRDVAGRPGATVNIMQMNQTGILGGILGVLHAGSNRRDIVAVRAGNTRVGEREIVVATARGSFSRWHVNRSGCSVNVCDVDLRETMISAIETAAPSKMVGRKKDQFVVVDVAVGDYIESSTGEHTDLDILVFTAFMPTPEAPGAVYGLVSVRFRTGGSAVVRDAHVIKSYTNPLEIGRVRPRLYLPKPRKTAFVVFARAVVLVSTQRSEQNEYEDMDMDDREGGVFEDVVDFRGDANVTIVGSGAEDLDTGRPDVGSFMGSFGGGSFGSAMDISFSMDSTFGKRFRNPGVVLVAKGAGVVRIEAFDMEEGPQSVRAVKEPVRVKSKIEQAVFYGIKEDNPLNFQGRKEIKYPIEEVEQAALEISAEILSSSSPYLPALLPSLDGHLLLRASHLRALADHLKITFPPLSKQAKWQLLSDAEKCEAARAVWSSTDARFRSSADEGESVLAAIITGIMSSDDIAGNDPVRTWFQRDVVSIAELLPLAKKNLVDKSTKGRREQTAFAKADIEANHIVIGALMTAWKFRVHAIKVYGLQNEVGVDSNGLLKNSKDLPPPWTSGKEILQALGDQFDVSRAVLKGFWGPKLGKDIDRREVAETVAGQLVGLVEVCCRGFEERVLWCEQQAYAGEGVLQEGIAIKERYYASRGGWIKPLVEIGRVESAFELAEKWQDYRSLVELSWEEKSRLEIALLGNEEEAAKEELARQRLNVMSRLEEYFAKFGEPFAMELYEYQVEKGFLQSLMDGFPSWREQYLTPFLRVNPRYAKISWMNDIHLKDYDRAAGTLLHIANNVEEDLWSKKIQISIGKLAAIASPNSDKDLHLARITAIDGDLELVKIQELLYSKLKHVNNSAIDAEAAVQIGVEEFAQGLKRRPGERELFKKAFKTLIGGRVCGVEEVVDLLTLIDGNAGLHGSGILDGEDFYWALRAVSLCALPRGRRAMVERCIWRRCFLRDDWVRIVDTKNKSDEQVQESTYDTALYATVLLGYEKGLFGGNSPFHPLSPEESLFSETVEELRLRFTEADEAELTNLAHDFMTENRKMRQYIQKANLRSWFDGLVAAACRTVEEAGENTEEYDHQPDEGEIEMDVDMI